jgi:hypothetical protein
MDRIGFDGRDLAYVVTSIDKASAVAAAETAKVVGRGALNIKKGAQKRIKGHPRFKRLPYAIDYDDVTTTSRAAYTEVGVNHGKRQGPLGGIAENGTPTSAPMPYMRPAVEAELPNFVRAMDDLAVKALGL